MVRREAHAQYSEYGFMNLNIGEECVVDNEEWQEIQNSVFEKMKDLDVSDIEGRLMNYTPFSIEAVFFASGFLEEEGKEVCTDVYLIVDVDEDEE